MEGRLYALLERTASSQQDRPALTFLRGNDGASSYTFGELFQRVRDLAAALRDTPTRIDASAPLGILLRSQEDQTLHYLASLRAGLVPAILTPPNRKLDRDYYARTMEAVIARCRFSALITDVDLELDVPRLAPFTFAAEGARPVSSVPTSSPPPSLDASFLQFSSGTTGIKRGVLVPDEAVLAQLRTYADALSLSQDDVIVSWLPLYHDMGFIACLNMPLAMGVHCVMIDPLDWVADPALFLRAASEHRATLAWNPNFAYAFMAQRVRDRDLENVELSSLRGLVNCSEPVTFESQRLFLERFTPLGLAPDVFWGCYAMAETTFALTHGTPHDRGYLDLSGAAGRAGTGGVQQVSVGHPLPGVELIVVDPEDGRELGEDTIGELWVRSPFNFTGYFNDEEATEQAFADGGWYRTGDLGYRAERAFYVVGRRKDVIIVGGVNVFPNDIEELVGRVPRVVAGRVSAFSTFDPSLQTERVTVLFESDAVDDELRALTLDVRRRVLAAFQVANFEVQAVPSGWLVKSSSGKMARGANREKWAAQRA